MDPPWRRHARTGLVSAVAMVVAALLVAASVAAGLRLPTTQRLTGYPPAARLESDRPPTGFVPLTQRFISSVLGLPVGAASGAGAGRPTGVGRPAADPRGVPSSTRVRVSHPFTNDSFNGAYVVPAVPFTARTATAAATREPGEPGACAPVGGTAWYRYTAVADERLVALTLGSDYALALGVFTGDGIDRVQRVGCSSGATRDAQVGFRARKGTTYHFQITGVAGGGNLVFTLNPVGRTDRVSVSSSGSQADSASYAPSVSADGRFVAFHSVASNLTPDQRPCSKGVLARTSCSTQVFVHDRVARTTSLVSVSSGGEPANGSADSPSLSADGRYVAFSSVADNLVEGVGGEEVYVRDRLTGITERVSEPASGDPGGGGGWAPAISDDGRLVAFLSVARDLIGSAAPACDPVQGCPTHVYLRDRLTRTTTLVSQTHTGGYANAGTIAASTIQQARPSISGDGRLVAFHSDATDLVPGDANGAADVFVRDVQSGRTELVSVSNAGAQGRAGSFGSSGGGRYVSADGRYVAFWSNAANLVTGDSNNTSDFFIRDRLLRTTTRVSVSSEGEQGHAPVTAPVSTAGGVAISGDGRFVSFDSALIDLADDAPSGPLQVYVRDLLQGVTTIASVTSLGDVGDWHSMAPALAARGEIVAFSSSASNLVADDTNTGCVSPVNTKDSCSDIFVHEMTSP